VTIVPAAQFDVDALAAVMTASYVDYFVPVVLDGTQMAAVIELWDLDLERSRVAVGDDGAPIGLVLLGVRGERSWVGGLGVVPESRRGGVGRALMESVLAAATADVSLEVIEQNEPAIRLYRDLGFEQTRMLEIWMLNGEVPEAEARAVEPQPLGRSDVPWQSADESLPAGYERLEVDGGAMLFRRGPLGVTVLQLEARDEAAARQLIGAAARGVEALRYVNAPAGEPGSAALRSLGATLEVRQLELHRYAS
jgi:ribosomal protein S18 acetylase RimI-like enzyme